VNIVTSLGTNLRQARELAEFSQQEIADVLGVVRETVSYWENDRRVPGAGQLARLAEAYGVTTRSLLGMESPPVADEDHELIYRALRGQTALTKAGVRRWLVFLDEWADLLQECDIALPGRARPPKREWRAAQPIRDSRLAPRLAQDVRDYYSLGTDAIPDLLAFHDRQGVLVYRVALDPIGDDEGVSGATYNHPRLGACILVNTATTPGRQTFTLVHELAHGLFHYQERAIISRLGDPDRTERFADAFAAHFLVPGDALRQQVAQLPYQKVSSAFDVVDLQRSFRVSYATMLNRLRGESLLSADQYREYRDYSPSNLAKRLGLVHDKRNASRYLPGISLGCYPTSVLDRVDALIRSDNLTPGGAADLLQVAQEEILLDLLAKPAPATENESREFTELPAPASVRRTGRNVTI
jgi:Zn-dependent peptidase ImmA (M78 family)/transcriptional regulator with XRE-family HTH domain